MMPQGDLVGMAVLLTVDAPGRTFPCQSCVLMCTGHNQRYSDAY